MDNLTHSLIGLALGQAGLKRRSGLAIPALVIGANLPDIDAPCVLYGVQSLAMRRGITHGPIALAVLPALLVGALIGLDRWQARRGIRPSGRIEVRPGWLFALAYLATLTHPLLDWFNSYGIRLFEPFSHRWFYGDALFIIDIWIWLMLGLGIWISRRRELAGAQEWARPARAALVAVAGYSLLNLGISTEAANSVRMDVPYAPIAVANPVPVAFWRRELLWRDGDRYGSVDWSLFSGKGAVEPSLPAGMGDPRLAGWVKGNRAAEAFLFWSRLPVAQPMGDAIVLHDQRFMQPLARGNFSVVVRPPR